VCGPNTVCTDKLGSYDCPCKTGFTGNGFDTTNGCRGETAGWLVLVARPASRAGEPTSPACLLASSTLSPPARASQPTPPPPPPPTHPPTHTADVTPPTLAFAAGVGPNDLTVAAVANAPAGSATVAFPALAASDTNTDGGANAPAALTSRARCLARVGAGGSWERVYPADHPSATAFPVGSLLVVCTTKDDAGNESPAVSFVVVVRCPNGYAFFNAACVGACARTEGGCRWGWDGVVGGTGGGGFGRSPPAVRHLLQFSNPTLPPPPNTPPHPPPDPTPRADDITPPSLTIWGSSTSATVGADDRTGTVVFPAMTADDNAPAGLRVECTAPISGVTTIVTSGVTKFPLGATEVACNAVDAAGNPSLTRRFTVSISCTGAATTTHKGTCAKVGRARPAKP
jgi:hypothetical protein